MLCEKERMVTISKSFLALRCNGWGSILRLVMLDGATDLPVEMFAIGHTYFCLTSHQSELHTGLVAGGQTEALQNVGRNGTHVPPRCTAGKL